MVLSVIQPHFFEPFAVQCEFMNDIRKWLLHCIVLICFHFVFPKCCDICIWRLYFCSYEYTAHIKVPAIFSAVVVLVVAELSRCVEQSSVGVSPLVGLPVSSRLLTPFPQSPPPSTPRPTPPSPSPHHHAARSTIHSSTSLSTHNFISVAYHKYYTNILFYNILIERLPV